MSRHEESYANDPEYRQVYAEEHMYTWIATQLVVLREQRGMTQGELAKAVGTQQPALSRWEDVNYRGWTVATLQKLANALGVRLRITFETFDSLEEDEEQFSRKGLERPLPLTPPAPPPENP